MEYIINVNGQDYGLPPKTLAVMEDLDNVLKVDENRSLSISQKYSKVHDFVKKTVGEENAKEMLGSDDLSEIELSELVLAVRKITDAYDKPIKDYEAEKARAALNNASIEKIIAMSKAAEKMASVQPQKKC